MPPTHLLMSPTAPCGDVPHPSGLAGVREDEDWLPSVVTLTTPFSVSILMVIVTTLINYKKKEEKKIQNSSKHQRVLSTSIGIAYILTTLDLEMFLGIACYIFNCPIFLVND